MCLPAFSNQYRYHTTCAILPNRAFSGEAGTWGRDSRGSPTDPQLEQCRCNAKPDLRYRARAATIAFCQPAAGIATNESDLAHGKRRSGILCQALFRVDIQVVSICRAMHNIPQGKHVPSRAHSDDSPKNESVPTPVRVTGRPPNSPPPELLKSTEALWSGQTGRLLARWGALHAVRSVLNPLALLLLLYLLIFAKS
jgi:hypothetical protein